MRITRLVRRGDVFYLRRRVPIRLVSIVDKWVIVRSLQIKNYYSALRQLACYDRQLNRIFDIIDAMSKLDPEFVKQYFHDLLRQWMGQNKDASVPAPAANIDEILQRLEDKDDDLLDIGTDFLMNADDLRASISLSDEPTVSQIGNLVLRTSLEHARQITSHP